MTGFRKGYFIYHHSRSAVTILEPVRRLGTTTPLPELSEEFDMCSISGIYTANNYYAPPELFDFANRMAATQAHRGPDDQGVWMNHSKQVALSHRRLSIIDTTHDGHQPMRSADGQLCITFNGEIYNYRELKENLRKKGVHFHTETDTEVLLAAYRFYGLEVFAHLDGMYAFCIYDQQKEELILARDPFGEKPLYYTRNQNAFAFASELGALESLPFFAPDIDHEAIGQYLLFQSIIAPRTIYRHAQALPPGSWMRVRNNTIDIGTHFVFAPDARYTHTMPLESATDELESLLEQSIARRLRSDVPIGFFLSAGIDSSLIAAISAKKLGVDLKTFSIGFAGSDKSEHIRSRITSEELQSKHYERILEEGSLTSFLNDAGDLLDQPNADTSCFPTSSLSSLAKKNVSVCLSGDGGNELFCGYNRNRVTLMEERDQLGAGSSSGWRAGDAYLTSRFLLFQDPEVAALCREAPTASLAMLRGMRQALNTNTTIPLVSRLRQFDSTVFLSGVVLPKVDRMSMRYALEVRCPFLTRDIAKFAERIPPELCFSNGQGKFILRNLINRYFPDGRLNLPKQGFGIHEESRCGVAVNERLVSLLKEPRLQIDDWISRNLLNQKITDPMKHGPLSIDQCWSILTLEHWLRRKSPRNEDSLRYG
jgi:asparagine synthase (glutamine-hydrolysing)